MLADLLVLPFQNIFIFFANGNTFHPEPKKMRSGNHSNGRQFPPYIQMCWKFWFQCYGFLNLNDYDLEQILATYISKNIIDFIDSEWFWLRLYRVSQFFLHFLSWIFFFVAPLNPSINEVRIIRTHIYDVLWQTVSGKFEFCIIAWIKNLKGQEYLDGFSCFQRLLWKPFVFMVPLSSSISSAVALATQQHNQHTKQSIWNPNESNLLQMSQCSLVVLLRLKTWQSVMLSQDCRMCTSILMRVCRSEAVCDKIAKAKNCSSTK